MKKFICCFLSVMLLMGCSVFTFAVSDNQESVWNEDDYTLVKGEPIGTPADEDGVLIENHTNSVAGAASRGLPFSMTGSGVTTLLTTRFSTGKNFTGGAFDAYNNEGLKITGRLTHTQGLSSKGGACYLDSSNVYQTVKTIYFASQVQRSAFIPKLENGNINFSNYFTYYGHITNYQGTGSVSGTLSFSKATG